MYWGSGNVEQQEGFVTGYLACTNRKIPSKAAVANTVAAISKWYEAHEGSEPMAKVADVLAIVEGKAGQPRKRK
jgi:hypothetical protein